MYIKNLNFGINKNLRNATLSDELFLSLKSQDFIEIKL